MWGQKAPFKEEGVQDGPMRYLCPPHADRQTQEASSQPFPPEGASSALRTGLPKTRAAASVVLFHVGAASAM
jgi:hypothetical protein